MVDVSIREFKRHLYHESHLLFGLHREHGFLAAFTVSLDLRDIDAHRFGQLSRRLASFLIDRIDMHSEKRGDLSVILIFKIIFDDDLAFLRSQAKEEIRTRFSVDPRRIRDAARILVYSIFEAIFDGLVGIGLHVIFIFDVPIGDISGILRKFLDMTRHFITVSIVEVGAEVAAHLLISLNEN